ncbi:CRISPR-associated endoribonuclease Cas6 [candidate division WOR-3 bacterium JGI_Cruoil_03_51_56]|uniref:CRISPR-associated endoribonuclease Cas6 n=1 Tax=candidate division WOR-3 bacterium JGI_Cruoil_03_51_56 TaxID=1973747 RepID=A0A235BYB0_UNCW3|nr:MAG: CRISPR-associated endoribonuclease Cas6 [candidate division WOR-3 bacterium JGI_Cruoil_03_51_56]
MRIRLEFESEKGELVVPVHYNQLIQGFIYHNLSASLADKIHSQGYKFEKRQFRMFTFSRLFGRMRHQDDSFIFDGPVSLWIASPQTEILESFCSHMARKGRVNVGNTPCRVSALEVPFTDFPSSQDTSQSGNPVSLTIRTLSPITVYSTLFTPEGKKKTYYYAPTEPEFSKQIAANLAKKATALRAGSPGPRLLGTRKPATNYQDTKTTNYQDTKTTNYQDTKTTNYQDTKTTNYQDTKTTNYQDTKTIDHQDTRITLTPVHVSARNQHIIMFKTTVIKAWSGIYKLTGPTGLLRLAFDTGLGAKNPQGFGMIEKWQRAGKSKADTQGKT